MLGFITEHHMTLSLVLNPRFNSSISCWLLFLSGRSWHHLWTFIVYKRIYFDSNNTRNFILPFISFGSKLTKEKSTIFTKIMNYAKLSCINPWAKMSQNFNCTYWLQKGTETFYSKDINTFCSGNIKIWKFSSMIYFPKLCK